MPFPGIPSGSVWCAVRSGALRTWKMCLFHLSITVRVWSTDVLPLSVTIWLKFVEVSGKKKTSQRVQKRKKERQAGPAAGALSKPAQALKDEIHFVSSSAPSPPDESSGGEDGEREIEGEIWREICLICQKFFNLIYSCQDAEDPDLITAFYLPDFTPGTRHSFLTHTHR